MVAVLPFADEAEAVALANDTEYGLSGSIFTRDLGRALRVSRAIQTGNLSVNSHSSVRYWTPFGGYKQSGLGRELGPGRAGRVHRGEERLLQPGLTAAEGRHMMDRAPDECEAGCRAGWPWSPEDAPGSGWRRARRLAAEGATVVIGDVDDAAGSGGGRRGRRQLRPDRRHRARSRSKRCSPRPRTPTARSTSRSTTPASPRRRTTRSSTPSWTPGAGCRRST